MSYTVGTYVGLPVAVIAVALAICMAVAGWQRVRLGDGSGDERVGWRLMTTAGISLLAIALIFTLSWWPFGWDYHRWHAVGGTVSSVDQHWDGSTYVFTLDHDDRQLLCADPGCAQVLSGDQIDMACLPQWRYQGADQWQCRLTRYNWRIRTP